MSIPHHDDIEMGGISRVLNHPAPASSSDLALKSSVDSAISTHEAAADPHPVYATDTDLSSAIATNSTGDRNRSNHTGTQLASTISDFASTVISTALSGFATGSKTAIVAADTILQAFGKIQAYINDFADKTISNTYTAGAKQIFSPNATNAGLNIGSTGTDPTTLVNGDIWYNSTTSKVLFRSGGVTKELSGVLNRRLLTTGTSYTPTAGTQAIYAVLIGGGGGGGGCTSAPVSAACGGGGSGGSECFVFINNIGAGPFTMAIGAGGTAGANTGGAGGTGGTTSLTVGATTYSAPGGAGGSGQTAGTAQSFIAGGIGSATPTNGLINVPGVSGGHGQRVSGSIGRSGMGGLTTYGPGGQERVTAASGNTPLGFGGGGSGGLVLNNSGAVIGGAGAQGCIYIEEYY